MSIWSLPVPHSAVIGWDLGGAHAKAALIDDHGCVASVVQVACPLWQGLEHLESGIEEILAKLETDGDLRHAVTMTGEMADLFPDRISGVNALIGTMTKRFPSAKMGIFGGEAGFLQPDLAQASALQVASANWLASASWAAECLPEGLLIDVGSTTTDLIPFANRQVVAGGFSDHQRLLKQTLVYTGVVRTPLMVITDKAPFAGEWVSLMAEYFATTADIYRINGDLPDDADLLPSADNGEKTLTGSIRRLARMLGLDAEATDLDGWRKVARYLAERQLRKIEDACERQLSQPGLSPSAPLVGAGVGRFLIERISQRLGRSYVDFSALFKCDSPSLAVKIAECAPAVSVASLAKGRGV
jgi:(4-(4-[2-(gamma-L-glutamylamino)ethyl]phenoxymethyl)furan-2-yl)methanamine synthase